MHAADDEPLFFSVCNLAYSLWIKWCHGSLCVYSAGIAPDLSPAHIPNEWAHPWCQGNICGLCWLYVLHLLVTTFPVSQAFLHFGVFVEPFTCVRSGLVPL